MKRDKNRGNPQIYHYLKRYQEDPTSRVFAPLAEAYRKAGLLDEAIEICRDGLRIHPHFIGGRVAMARALFDQKSYAEVIQELEPVVLDAPDNLVAQKLLAESYLILGRVTQSLAAYKVLMFFMPQDEEIARLVQEIETRAYEDGSLILQHANPGSVVPLDPQRKALSAPAEPFTVQRADTAISGDPEVRKTEWMSRVEILQALLIRIQRYKLAKTL